MSEREDKIKLMIKAPNQNIGDFAVDCNLNWTIGDLKEYLSEEYPNKPDALEQRLIYSGRLLHNHLHLKDILRYDEDEHAVHTLHLVCKANSYTSSYQNSNLSTAWSINPVFEQPTAQSEINSTPEPSSSPENSVRQRITPVDTPINPDYSLFQNPVTVILPFTDNAQVLAQMSAMQQMYVYYMNQYMQSMNTGAINNPLAPPEVTNFQPNNPNANETPLQRPMNQRLNAQGGQVVEENDEMANRDWLDHLFLCCRFLILFSIVYFYSTPERLMIVIVCAVIAFLYHEGWFVRRTRPVPVAPEVQVPRGSRNNRQASPNEANPEVQDVDEVANLVNQELDAYEDLHNEQELEAAMDGDDPPHVQNADAVNNNNNQIVSPLTFLSSFFASLIPEPPPPVNIN